MERTNYLTNGYRRKRLFFNNLNMNPAIGRNHGLFSGNCIRTLLLLNKANIHTTDVQHAVNN